MRLSLSLDLSVCRYFELFSRHLRLFAHIYTDTYFTSLSLVFLLSTNRRSSIAYVSVSLELVDGWMHGRWKLVHISHYSVCTSVWFKVYPLPLAFATIGLGFLLLVASVFRRPGFAD